jgi:chlorophyllide a reductase subunit Y
MLEPMGLAAGPVVPTREWRELYAALDSARGGRDPSVLHGQRSANSRRPAAAVVGSAPVGHDGTDAWLKAIGDRLCQRADKERSTRPRTAFLPAIKGALAANPIKGRITLRATKAPNCWWPACWSKAARTCATSAPPARARTLERADREWLEARGVHVQYRASLEQDLAAMQEFQPDLAIGTTPVVQKAKEAASRRCTSPT